MALRILLAGAMLAAAASSISATDFVVSPGGSIQAAIDAASAGDRVLVQPGVYQQSIDLKGKAIEVIGVGGAAATTLGGSLTSSGPTVRMWSGEGPSTRIAGFSIFGGHGVYGGGISGTQDGTLRATARVEDCVIAQNSALHGGGVAGDFLLARCSIWNNLAIGGDAGGVWGGPVLHACRLYGNDTVYGLGGGLYVPDGSSPAQVTDSVLHSNSAIWGDGSGAGIHLAPGATAQISGTQLYGNKGGASVDVELGVAVYVAPTALAVLERCTVTSNSSSFDLDDVGGVYGPATLRHCILWGNSGAELGGGASATYSDVDGGAPGVGNLNADPAFVGKVGTGTDQHLTPASPCVDAGEPGVLDPDGSPVDLGAFPLQELYVNRELALLSPLSFAAPTWTAISSQVGGVYPMRLVLDASHAGAIYIVLGSVSGTAPGTPFLGAHLPLNFDGWFLYTLTHPDGAVTEDSAGFLDADGRADANFKLPPFALGGPATAHHAAVVFDPVTLAVVTVSNALEVQLLP